MSEIKIEKATIDSLMFFCFGITLFDDYDAILGRVIEKAYNDATNQGAFNTKADQSAAAIAKYGDNGSVKIIRNRVNLLLSDNDISFDEWHECTCDELIKIYSNNNLQDVFSYGNAQKWVNMTLKYLYLLSGISAEYDSEFISRIIRIRKYASELYIPIDSYIIDVLWTDHNVNLPVKEEVHVDRNKNYSVPSIYVKGWSNWTKAEYLSVNDSVKQMCGLNPMEWEAEKWISRAKERKKVGYDQS